MKRLITSSTNKLPACNIEVDITPYGSIFFKCSGRSKHYEIENQDDAVAAFDDYLSQAGFFKKGE